MSMAVSNTSAQGLGSLVEQIAQAHRASYQATAQVLSQDQHRVADATQTAIYDAVGQTRKAAAVIGQLVSVKA